MAPGFDCPARQRLGIGLGVAQHPAKIVADLDLEQGRGRAGLGRHIVLIVHQRRDIAHKRWQRLIPVHMRLVAKTGKRNRPAQIAQHVIQPGGDEGFRGLHRRQSVIAVHRRVIRHVIAAEGDVVVNCAADQPLEQIGVFPFWPDEPGLGRVVAPAVEAEALLLLGIRQGGQQPTIEQRSRHFEVPPCDVTLSTVGFCVKDCL